MKTVAIAMVFAACALADQKLVEVKNIDVRNMEAFMESFGVTIKMSPNPHFIVLRGEKAAIDTAEAALRRIDLPAKNFDITVQILSATVKPEAAGAIPADLESVVKQIRKNFVYQGFRLVDSIDLRTREGEVGQASSAAPITEVPNARGNFNVRLRPTLSADDKGSIVRLDGFQFGAKLPVPAVADKTSWNWVDTGFHESVDVREGQKVVVGRANLNGQEGAFFLVVTAKIVD